jgi:hypothetical protein
VRDLVAEIEDKGLSSEPEYKYKVGELLHWMESVQAACELWALSRDDNYLNAVVIQYNGLVTQVNSVISEGALDTEFMLPIRQVAISGDTSDPVAFLKDLFYVQNKVKQMPIAAAGD